MDTGYLSEFSAERGVQLVVGRVGAPHGVRGEVAVEVRTDDPAARFAAGSVLSTEPETPGTLTVEGSRWHKRRLLVRFAEITDRTAAEGLRGAVLVIDSGQVPSSASQDEFHDHELLGLAVVSSAGQEVGTATDVLHLPEQDVLVVRTHAGADVLLPFVSALVGEVDRAAGRIVADPPPGLMDIDVSE